MDTESIRELARQGLQWGGRVPTPEQVEHVVAQALKLDKPARGAWLIGRNYAIDLFKREKARARAIFREIKAQDREALRQLAAEQFLAAQAEFARLVPAIVGRWPSYAPYCEALVAVVFDRLPSQVVAQRYGTTAMNIDQRISRVRRALKAFGASPNLQRWAQRRVRN